jgi:hypothetical protein
VVVLMLVSIVVSKIRTEIHGMIAAVHTSLTQEALLLSAIGWVSKEATVQVSPELLKSG